MIEFSKLEKNILLLLSDEHQRSINEIMQILHAPVEQIRQSIHQLKSQTNSIIETNKDCFKLTTPYFPIDKSHLQETLYPIGFKDIYCFDSIDSTNLFLKQNKQLRTPALCTSNMQTAGRGRHGRNWYSPYASNLYFSIKYTIPTSIANCAGLSLMIGVSLVEAIENLLSINNILLKWPNDLVYNKQKVAGILIEISENLVIIGIGINVNCLSHQNPMITKPWISLREIYQKPIIREPLLLACIECIDNNSKLFFEKGFGVFHEKWQNKDAYKDEQISLIRGNEIIEGQTKGISKNGNLLILNHQGKLQEIESGELS